MQMFDIRQLRTLGLSNYMIDMILKAGTINPGTPGTNTGPNEMPLIAKIGTTKADNYGWMDGDLVISHAKLKDRGVTVIVDHVIMDSEDMGAGNPFFTKNLADNFITFSDAIADGETYLIIIT